tara:strand:+ start:1547 stop:2128 length:582 start_codon:yes stop_codon:yes gene_type:complete
MFIILAHPKKTECLNYIKKLLTIILFISLSIDLAFAKSNQDTSANGFVSYQPAIYGREFDNASLAVEYRHPKLYTKYDLRPINGILLTTADDWFAFIGLMHDFRSKTPWVTSFSFSIMGYYHSSDEGRDLNFPVEFRSKIESAYRFSNQIRLGIGFSHISNARLSHIVYDKGNPGVEILSLSVSVPINKKQNK